jgi:hypothetical protein
MFRVTYAGESFLTGTAIGEAVLAYARKLALKDRADTVTIPGLLEDGSPTVVELLIGPASQILLARIDSDQAEPEDESVVAELVRRTDALEGSNAVPIRGSDIVDSSPDFEYD